METEERRRVRRRKRGVGRGVLLALLSLVSLYLWARVLLPVEDEWDGEIAVRQENGAQNTPEPVRYDVDEDTLAQLQARAKQDKRYKPLAKSPEAYPADLLRQVLRNGEVLDFTLDYPENVGRDWRPEDITLDVPEGIPHYLQWDARWGYGAYGSSVVGVSGCGPTCLSMAVVGLTGNTAANPLAVAQYSAAQGWYVPGSGTDWELLRAGAEHYGLSWQELSPEAEAMEQVLDRGGCIIAGMLPGDFTAAGHFILIRGYDAAGFQVLDPNSKGLSRSWTLAELKPQLAVLWGYTA